MLYMEDGILVNSATFTDGETWFELIGTIGTAGGRFSFMQAHGFAEATGTELCEGKRLVEADVVEIADVEPDCAGTYPLVM